MTDETRKAREYSLLLLNNQTGDSEADHGNAETALTDWLKTFDPELATAWNIASGDWWYA